MNFLFVLSFPVFGVGNYISASLSPSTGYIISIFPLLLIVLIYCTDLLYIRKFQLRLNNNYFLALVFLISSAASLFLSYSRGMPDISLMVVIFKSILILSVFHAFIVVNLYNMEEPQQKLVLHTLYGLSLLLLINMAGYFGLGLSNEGHYIEGRINLPFVGGIYQGSGMLAVISLLLLCYFKSTNENVLLRAGLTVYLLTSLAMIFMINSRLCILILLMVIVLYLTGAAKKAKGLFMLSQFTLPILMSSGLLIYQVLQLPVMSSILMRVDLVDVVTFNGRLFLWQDAIDWMLYDRRGFLFGNGYHGQYFLDLVSDVAKMWNEENVQNLHFHSTSLEILVNQGLIGFGAFVVLCYKAYKYYRSAYQEGREEWPFFIVMLFLLFILQSDTFVYMETIGFFIWSVILSKIVMKEDIRPEIP